MLVVKVVDAASQADAAQREQVVKVAMGRRIVRGSPAVKLAAADVLPVGLAAWLARVV
jgi:hypothetical protein